MPVYDDPKPLTARQRHTAQRIKAMWIVDGEQYDNAVHNYNRYGIQLRQKVITSVGRIYGALRIHSPRVDTATKK